MTQHLYVYGTGEREDGFRFAVGHHHGHAPAPSVALFQDKVDAHLYAYDKAERLYGCRVLIQPSAGLGTSRTGWPLYLLRSPYKGATRGDLIVECPDCASLNTFTSIRPGGTGTGPGRTWRMGDSGAHEYTECGECHTASDLPAPRPVAQQAGTGHRGRADGTVTVEQVDPPPEPTTEPRMGPVMPCDGDNCDAPIEIQAGDGRRFDDGTDHPHTCYTTPAWVRTVVRAHLTQRPPEPAITQPTDTTHRPQP